MEHALQIISGKVARDRAHIFFSHRPTQKVSQVIQWLKGTCFGCCCGNFYISVGNSGVGTYLGVRGYLAVNSGTNTDEIIKAYIDVQEGEQIVDDNLLPIDPS